MGADGANGKAGVFARYLGSAEFAMRKRGGGLAPFHNSHAVVLAGPLATRSRRATSGST